MANIGTRTSPTFSFDRGYWGGLEAGKINPFLEIEWIAELGRPTPFCMDLDLDGDNDCLIGDERGGVRFFLNTGNASYPILTQVNGLGDKQPFKERYETQELATGHGHSAPSCADIDGDGDVDCFWGFYTLNNGVHAGKIYMWQNSGQYDNVVMNGMTISVPKYDFRYGSYAGNAPFWGMTWSLSVGATDAAITPSFADIDNDGDYDVILGTYNGVVEYYENTGSMTDPVMTKRKCKETHPFSGMSVGVKSSPFCIDLDADGDIDCIIGNKDGNVKYFQNYAMQQHCFYGGSFSTEQGRCVCAPGYSGPQCDNKCPGVGERDPDSNTDSTACYGHGACYSTGTNDPKEGSCLCP